MSDATSIPTWRRVIEASDCEACDWCGELVCPVCLVREEAADPHLPHSAPVHYVDCTCPGPHQDDEFEYRETPAGTLEARRLSDG